MRERHWWAVDLKVPVKDEEGLGQRRQRDRAQHRAGRAHGTTYHVRQNDSTGQ